MALAFEDVTIIDFTHALSGPAATQQLAVLGANVIKIERRDTGDQMAQIMATEASERFGRSFTFMTTNMNKRSLSLDLKKPEAAEIIKTLVARADVVVENFAAGMMDRLGIGYEVLKEINPSLIFCSISGYGQSGPMAGQTAYDPAVQAGSGMMSVTGFADGNPVRAGFPVVDVSTGLQGAIAIMGALYRRKVTGEGQFLDVAMMDTAVLLQQMAMANHMNAGIDYGRNGNRGGANLPTVDTFPAKEGYLAITALKENQIIKLMDTLGCGEVLQDPRFADAPARQDHFDELQQVVTQAMAADTAANWYEKLRAAGVPCNTVRETRDVVKDPQFDHRGVLCTVPAPGMPDEMVRGVSVGYVADIDGPTPGASPALGEHKREILAEAGFSTEQIAAFEASETI